MRIFNLLALSLILSFALVGCQATKVGVLDTVKIFQDSDAGKAGIAHLQTIEADMQEQLKKVEGLIAKAPKDEAMRTRMQKTFADYQQTLQAEQEKVMKEVNALVESTLEAYRAKNKITAVFSADSLIVYDPKINITPEVIADMNKTSISFPVVKLEELK